MTSMIPQEILDKPWNELTKEEHLLLAAAEDEALAGYQGPLGGDPAFIAHLHRNIRLKQMLREIRAASGSQISDADFNRISESFLEQLQSL